MARVTSIINQKGGVGKTTTAHNLGTGLTLKGYKTLLVDADPQGNLSFVMGVDDVSKGLYEVMRGDFPIENCIQHLSQGDILPSTLLLTASDLEFTQTGREYILKDVFSTIHNNYDYIIIDCPPQLGILTINSLSASDDLVIPLGADIFSLQGLNQLFGTIEKVKRYCNLNLEIAGLLITRYTSRTILTKDLKEIIEQKSSQLQLKLFKSIIRESISIKEAQTLRENLYTSHTSANSTQDYLNFIDEYIRGEN